MNTGVYRIRNIVNGKIYIGSTAWDFQKRWKTHRNQLRRNKHDNPHLQYSWNKHGEPNFSFEIVEPCDKSMCFIREQHYIDTLHPQYNILQNAGTVRGYKHSPATKALIGAASAGVNHPCYSGEHVFFNPLHGTFEGSIVDFGKRYNLRKCIPYKLTSGSLSKSHGWIYLGKLTDKRPTDLLEFYKQRIFNNKPKHNFIHDNGLQFCGTRSEFIRKYGLDRSTICKLVNKKRTTAFGWSIKS